MVDHPSIMKCATPCIALAALFACFLCTVNGTPCALKAISTDHLVCVCNSTYCDTAPSVGKLNKGQYLVITTTESGRRFSTQVLNATSKPSAEAIYEVNPGIRRQAINGFGGAFTDAAGINIASLSPESQEKLISSYYGLEGLGYTIGRIPMASCDFSTHAYSYDDTDGDFNLTHFALAEEDFKYKIPYVKKALEISPAPIKVFGSPWSAPAWMKDNKNMTGKGSLIGQPGGEYYKTWAKYFVRFLEEYEKQGIKLWGLTVENEPSNGLVENFRFQCMGFTPELSRDFIKMDLGPALEKAGYGVDKVELMMLDDQRDYLVNWMKVILSDPDANKYVTGVGVHWYGDVFQPSSLLTDGHNLFPDKFIFATEASEGTLSWQADAPVDLGSWERGSLYAIDIIEDLNNWVNGWTDWNLALDLGGGPNWVGNFLDSPIIVDSKKNEFYKQPMFYVMGHFSKYIVPDSVWIEAKASKVLLSNIQITAFHRPDESIAVVIHNNGADDVQLDLTDASSGYLHVASPGKSIQTVIWYY